MVVSQALTHMKFFDRILDLFKKVENLEDENVFSENFISTLPKFDPFNYSWVDLVCRDHMPANVKLRNAIETWFKSLPDTSKKDTMARLRKVDDKMFLGAFFELALHQYFLEKGYKVEKPTLQNGKTPDFRLIVDASELYVEARTIMLENTAAAAEKRQNQALVALGKIATHYSLTVCFDEDPKTTIKPNDLRKAVGDWLHQLNLSTGQTAETKISAGGFSIELIAKNRVGIGPRTITSMPPVGWLGSSFLLMRKGIKYKAAKYKDIQNSGIPYVVAVCSTDMNVAMEEIWMTLAAHGTLDPKGVSHGAFNVAYNTGVSAILHAQLLKSHDDFEFQISVLKNPFAKTPIPMQFGFENEIWKPQ